MQLSTSICNAAPERDTGERQSDRFHGQTVRGARSQAHSTSHEQTYENDTYHGGDY